MLHFSSYDVLLPVQAQLGVSVWSRKSPLCLRQEKSKKKTVFTSTIATRYWGKDKRSRVFTMPENNTSQFKCTHTLPRVSDTTMAGVECIGPSTCMFVKIFCCKVSSSWRSKSCFNKCQMSLLPCLRPLFCFDFLPHPSNLQ